MKKENKLISKIINSPRSSAWIEQHPSSLARRLEIRMKGEGRGFKSRRGHKF